jgi:hypothetical protein
MISARLNSPIRLRKLLVVRGLRRHDCRLRRTCVAGTLRRGVGSATYTYHGVRSSAPQSFLQGVDRRRMAEPASRSPLERGSSPGRPGQSRASSPVTSHDFFAPPLLGWRTFDPNLTNSGHLAAKRRKAFEQFLVLTIFARRGGAVPPTPTVAGAPLPGDRRPGRAADGRKFGVR